jgi:hypothetical protein
LRPQGEERLEQVFGVLVQYEVVSAAPVVFQRGWVAGIGVRLQPVVHGLPAHPEHAGDIGGRPAVVELQDGQGAPKETHIIGGRELSPKVVPLPRRQMELAHGLLPPCARYP